MKHKLLPIILVFLLCLSLPVHAKTEDFPSGIWDGSVAENFTGGTGTEKDPHIIKTPAELAFFARSVNEGNRYENMYITLAADIRLNDEKFTFDADTGLVKVTDGEHTAYFGTGIEEIQIDNSLICGGSYTGSIAGYGNARFNGVTRHCINNGIVIGINCVGGIVGNNTSLFTDDCYHAGSVEGNRNVGGIGGYASSVKTCSAWEASREMKSRGAIIGYVPAEHTVECCYYLLENGAVETGIG